MKCIFGIAVVSLLRIWDGQSLSIKEGHALIEVRTVLQVGDVRGNILWFCCLLMESVLSIAIVSLLWIWNSQGFSINKSESLVEVWAVLDTSWVERWILDELLDSILLLDAGCSSLTHQTSNNVLHIIIILLKWKF